MAFPFNKNTFSRAAISTNTPACAEIGLDVLKRGGSVADAAIAVLLGEGVCCPQSLGIGGGFLLTIYNKEQNKVEVLNARERAPGTASKYMYGREKNHKDITEGGLAVAVPGEIKGYWELHRKYGRLNWQELFQPTINMCRKGIFVTKYVANILARSEKIINQSPTLKEVFINQKTGKVFKEGDLMVRPQLAMTLNKIALQGPEALYDGVLTDNFLRDIRENEGIITADDLKSYSPKWQEAIHTDLPGNYVAYSVPPPGAGSILFTVIDILSKTTTSDPNIFWHNMVEGWKFAFAKKAQMSGPIFTETQTLKFSYNPRFADSYYEAIDENRTFNTMEHYYGMFDAIEDHGTCHISVLAPNGDGIAATSTINWGLGALFISRSTGIILNNEMMDFAIPHYTSRRLNPSNFIEPYKQPMSSMCPTIIIDKTNKNIRLIVGGAGGFRIITATTQVIARNILLNEPLELAVAQPRLHHQLNPMMIDTEEGFPSALIKGLKLRGHDMRFIETAAVNDDKKGPFPNLPSVNAISVENGEIHATGDPRRFAAGLGY